MNKLFELIKNEKTYSQTELCDLGKSKGCKTACCSLPIPLSMEELLMYNIMYQVDKNSNLMKKQDGTCVYLSDDKTCSIYHSRPSMCRTYRCDNDPAVPYEVRMSVSLAFKRKLK